MRDALASIVTVEPLHGESPAQPPPRQYPFSAAEMRRLTDFQTFLCARVWLHDQGLPCSKRDAKRLAFARFLATSGRLSEETT